MKEGQSFEEFVYNVYKMLKNNVKNQVRLRKKHKFVGREYVTFDISYGFPFTHLVECKYKSGGVVDSSDIMKFVGDMISVGIPTSRGEFVTNTTYAPQAVDYARRYKIKLIDGVRLNQMYEKTIPNWMKEIYFQKT